MVYKGALDPYVIFMAICNSFKDIPEGVCSIGPTAMDEFIAIMTLIGMLVFVICLNGLFLYIGHRMRREIIDDLARSEVQQYMTVLESDIEIETTKGKPKGNEIGDANSEALDQ